jgi:hypothetical protein
MSRYAGFCIGLLCVVTAGCATTVQPMRTSEGWQSRGKQRFERVLVIMLENQDADKVLDYTHSDPAIGQYFKKLAERGASFKRFDGIRHPSYPNYIGLVAGNTRYVLAGLLGDLTQDRSERSLADLLEAKGRTWKNYVERYPGNCFQGEQEYRYVRRHVPFINFKAIQQDPQRCAKVVEAEQFWKDVLPDSSGKLPFPNFGFYSPDLCNSGHGDAGKLIRGNKQECEFGMSDPWETRLNAAMSWLRGFLGKLIEDGSRGDLAEFRRTTLIVVTFDESDSHSDQDGPVNRVFTVFLGPMVKAGYVSDIPTNHYNVLRTIEDNFDLESLGEEDARNGPVMDVWQD